MTCDVAREQLSAFLDDALAGPTRRALDAHLAECAECRRELDRLRATVALLGRLSPVHAPAGFVDRVMARAGRPPWPRRVLDLLFRPLRVKLPLEAAAVLLVAVSAVYVYEHTPEVRPLARQESRESAPAPAGAPSSPVTPMAGAGGQAPGPEGESLRAKQDAAREEAVRQPPSPGTPPGPPAEPAPSASGASPLEAPASQSAARPGTAGERPSGARKETQGERSDATGAAPASNALDKAARAVEPAPPRDAAASRAPGATTVERGPPPALAPAAQPEVRGRAAGAASAPSPAPAPEGAASDSLAPAKPRTAARLMRASDASGRLVVAAREPAEVALDALLTRLGGTRVARRLDQPRGPVLIDVVVPAPRYGDLLEGLTRIGQWTTEHEPKTLPPRVRVEVAVTVVP